MPSNLVNTPQDEKIWNKVKSQIREKYDNIEFGSHRYWKLVMKAYLRVKGRPGVK